MALYNPATVAAAVAANEGAVWNALDANPGGLLGAIAQAGGVSELIAGHVLAIFVRQGLAVRAGDGFWLARDWCDEVKVQVPAARAWLAQHDGGSKEELAAALGIGGAMAEKVLAYLKDAGAVAEK